MYQRIVGSGTYIDSVGSTSGEWIDRTFTNVYSDTIKQTPYISGNPYSKNLDKDDFGLLDHVWKYAWDDELGTILPNQITDRGISVVRSGEYTRVILHYMQPYNPFIANNESIGKVSNQEDSNDRVLIDVWE